MSKRTIEVEAPRQWRNRIVDSADVAPESLRSNPMNWRLHPGEQEEALEEVLRRVGWVGRVIVNRTTGNVVDGHLRVALAIKRQEPVVPVDYVDLTEEDERMVLAAFDPIAAMAATDFGKLRALMADVEFDDGGALATMMAELEAERPAIKKPGKTDPDEVPAERETEIQRGDLFQLGRHRLLCGDSASADDVARLIGTDQPAVVVTDPPYNVGFEYGDAVDDEKTKAEYLSWCRTWFGLARALSQSCVVLTSGITNMPMWIADIERTHRVLAWVKENQCSRNYIGTTSGFNVWEPILVFGKAKKCVARDSFSIPIHIQADTGDHPCPKSIKAWSWLVENFSDEGDVLYEPFSGSGTTIIACEQMDRSCVAIEIEPKVVQLAIDRWEQFTGLKAVKL